MELFLRIIQHLLPKSQAFRITVNKPLRRFFVALAEFFQSTRKYLDDIYDDIFPATTRELSKWEDQFALPASLFIAQERRDRLDAAWKATGGQSPSYIQNTLRNSGFDVYVHESFEPGTTTIRNPNTILAGGSTVTFFEARSGDGDIRSGSTAARSGNFTGLKGSALTNITGNTTSPTIPSDSTKWPFFVYIGGQTFPELATIPPSRKDEFLALCLKICPTHLWIGILVEYA